MALKSQDVMVALKLLSKDAPNSFAGLAESLSMSASEVHSAVKRLQSGRLLFPHSREVIRQALLDFLLHGVAHVFPAQEGATSRGMLTAWAAPVMEGKVKFDASQAPVWPHTEGTARGLAVMPLYRSAPKAAERAPELYDLMALVDVLRMGRARERKIAETILREKFNQHG
jgi:hypothetical protein